MHNLNYIHSFPGLIAAKNQESSYLAMSPIVSRMVGWKSTDDCIGKNDYDIPCHAVNLAGTIIEMDSRAISINKKLTSIETHHYTTGWRSLLAERNPVIDNISNEFSLIIQSIDVSHTHLAKCSILLSQVDKKIVNKPSIYILSDDFYPLPLTDRQKTCLFLLLRGKTTKGIASILNLSVKTVEEHISIIKRKMNCYSKSDLIEKAIDSGFLFYIPQSLLNDDFKKAIKF